MIKHVSKQLFAGVIEKYDHKYLLFVVKLSGDKIRVVLSVSEKEAIVTPIERCSFGTHMLIKSVSELFHAISSGTYASMTKLVRLRWLAFLCTETKSREKSVLDNDSQSDAASRTENFVNLK